MAQKIALDFEEKFKTMNERDKIQRRKIDELNKRIRLEKATKYTINQTFNNFGLLGMVDDKEKKGSFFQGPVSAPEVVESLPNKLQQKHRRNKSASLNTAIA